jgi:DNA-binding NarL/FixJ family response regulator
MNSPLKLVLIDDHQILIDGLKSMLNSIENISVVATFTDSRKIIPFLEENSDIDIVITDLHIPHLTGIDLTLQIRRVFPNIKVLLLTMADEAVHIREAMKVGVHGYILKNATKDDFKKAFEKLSDGKRFYSQEVIEELAHTPTDDLNQTFPEAIQHLTMRELEILKLVAAEQSTAQIAEQLCVSVPTVETHRRNLMQKLNAKNVVGLIKYAMKHGLVD